MKIFAIVPALNEYQHLRNVVEETLQYTDHVIVVDDGSNTPLEDKIDGSDTRVTFLRHRINLGKGAALKTGVLAAKKLGANVVVFIDSDGQHLPKEIPILIKPILENRAEIVFGVREFHEKMPLVAKFGNKFLTLAVKLLFNVNVEDTQSGFRAFNITILDKLYWNSARYSVETEMIVNVGKNNLKWAEVPISTIYTDKYRGTTVIDGFRIFINMLNWKLK